MQKYLFIIAVFIISLMPTNMHAEQATNELGVCFTDSLTGKERKILAKWIFFAISAHPEISPYLNATVQTKDEINKSVGKLVTRLLAEDCPRQTKAALKKDGSLAMQTAFGLVGQAAIQELMTRSHFKTYLKQ